MALSVGGLNNNYSVVRPMNYSVENNSAVSDAYTQSVKQTSRVGSFADVLAVQPVGYANAQISQVNPMAQLEQSKKVGQEFNQIASGFSGMTTGYTQSSAAVNYQMIGSNVDLFV